MGACNVGKTITVDTNKGETLKSVWREFIDGEYHQYGSDGYNGKFTTCDGGSIKVAYPPSSLDLTDQHAIWDWFDKFCEKRAAAKAILVSEEKGIETWEVGGLAAC